MNAQHLSNSMVPNVRSLMVYGVIFMASLIVFPVAAQSYSIDWHKVAGGGGTSTSATYQVTGTIGQPDASGPLTGGSYSITGGFWSLVSVVETPGVPKLIIVPNGLTEVKILWPDTGSFTLQQNTSLTTPANWTASSYSVTTANGTNSVIVTAIKGNLFFRLSNP